MLSSSQVGGSEKVLGQFATALQHSGAFPPNEPLPETATNEPLLLFVALKHFDSLPVVLSNVWSNCDVEPPLEAQFKCTVALTPAATKYEPTVLSRFIPQKSASALTVLDSPLQPVETNKETFASV